MNGELSASEIYDYMNWTSPNTCGLLPNKNPTAACSCRSREPSPRGNTFVEAKHRNETCGVCDIKSL